MLFVVSSLPISCPRPPHVCEASSLVSVERMQHFPSKTGRAHDAALLCKWLESELVVNHIRIL